MQTHKYYRYQYDTTGVVFETTHSDITHAVTIHHVILFYSSLEDAEACRQYYKANGESVHLDTVKFLGEVTHG